MPRLLHGVVALDASASSHVLHTACQKGPLPDPLRGLQQIAEPALDPHDFGWPHAIYRDKQEPATLDKQQRGTLVRLHA